MMFIFILSSIHFQSDIVYSDCAFIVHSIVLNIHMHCLVLTKKKKRFGFHFGTHGAYWLPVVIAQGLFSICRFSTAGKPLGFIVICIN